MNVIFHIAFFFFYFLFFPLGTVVDREGYQVAFVLCHIAAALSLFFYFTINGISKKFLGTRWAVLGVTVALFFFVAFVSVIEKKMQERKGAATSALIYRFDVEA